jgi:hypothetical protein
MKKILSFIITPVITYCCIAQNVGVGTASPIEKLDVNGNLNVSGQLKINGNAGAAGQVLMKDAGNNTVWGDLSDYKNMIVFDCNSTTSNCAYAPWIVPSNVTRIFIECWGGGGGGCNLTGGGGSGYIAAKIDVTPASSATFTIGAGGTYGTLTTNAVDGGQTSFSIGTITLYANGGGGGFAGDILFPTLSFAPPSGGTYAVSGSPGQYIGFYGSPGGITELNYVQVSTTEFAKVIRYGDGGDAALLPGSGIKGGYKFTSSTLQNTHFTSLIGIKHGGGGGADTGLSASHVGGTGFGGRIIIHW